MLANACGPCIGQWRRPDAGPGARTPSSPRTTATSRAATTATADDAELHRQPRDRHRARARRPAVVQPAAPTRSTARTARRSASAAAGRRPRCPPHGFERGRRGYVAPPEDGSRVELERRPGSERLQRARSRGPRWDGQDFHDMPVLIKTQGKTTTDHISPAGPWLRYRGHLDKFSDNLFMGAVERLHRRARAGTERAHRARRGRIAEIARDYQAQGLRLGRRRRRELRRGQQPRARRAVAAPPRRRGGHRPQLRAHPRVQPEEAGAARR